MNIIVESIRELTDSGNLKAFVTVSIKDKLKIYGCRIIQQPGQIPWVSLPQNEWIDPQGNKKYFPVIELSEKVKNAISEAILEAWQGERNV